MRHAQGDLFLLSLGITASSTLRLALWSGLESNDRIYFGLDTRCYALLLGCLVALVVSWGLIRPTAKVRVAIRVGTGAWLLALAVALVGAPDRSQLAYQELGTVASITTAALLLHVVYCPSRPRAFILDNPVLGWVGRLSYGLYLWHDPIFLHMLNTTRMAKIGLTGVTLSVVRFGVTFMVASVSFYLIERPCLNLKQRFTSRGGPVLGAGPPEGSA